MEHAQVLEKIKSSFPKAVIAESTDHAELIVTLSPESFVEVMQFLRQDEQLSYDLLVDVVGMDYLPRTPRFEVAYVLFATQEFRRLVVKLQADEGTAVPTVTGIWKSADWPEREVYDLLGIEFAGHPDLRRILTWDNFDGHPLRKDYPLRGKDFDKKFDPDSIVVT